MTEAQTSASNVPWLDDYHEEKEDEFKCSWQEDETWSAWGWIALDMERRQGFAELGGRVARQRSTLNL